MLSVVPEGKGCAEGKEKAKARPTSVFHAQHGKMRKIRELSQHTLAEAKGEAAERQR